ncbi:MAG TPA: SDR family NAD(P)-dependent oxidoreductase [Chloroflexota bacterium]|jgi:NAD(P)-dependent dehydrogenase (short-subunit alcohol dehydrogenase family)
MRLSGKVAVVTGAASGIGRETARLFAAEGARVFLADVQTEAGGEAAKDIRGHGGQAHFVACDVSQTANVRRLMETVRRECGRLDVLFANAGIGGFGTFLDRISEERWQRLLDVDLSGPFLCLKYGIPLLIESGGGSVILTASIGGLAAFPGSAGYSAAKGGIIAMARTAAIEYAAQQVRVNAICPGYIQTQLSAGSHTDEQEREAFWGKLASDTPLRRMGTPRDIANMALFLASDESSYITGVAIAVDGGVTAGNIAPGWPVQLEE